MTKVSKLSRAVQYFTGVIGLFLLAYILVFYANEGTKVDSWRNSGVIQSDVKLTEDSLAIFRSVKPVDFLSPPYPHVGDTIVSLADSGNPAARWTSYFESPRKPGELYAIEFNRNGEAQRNVIKTTLPTLTEFGLILFVQIVRFLISAAFVVVGLWAFWKQPHSRPVRALALFSFSMSSFMIASVSALSKNYAAFEIPYNQEINNFWSLITAFFGAFWLNLAMLFPRSIKLMERRPFWAYFLCYAPMILCFILVVVVQNTGHKLDVKLILIFIVTVCTQVIFGFLILNHHRKTLENKLEQRQVKLVLLGAGCGLGMLFLLVLIVNIFNDWFMSNKYLAICTLLLAFLGLLLVPITFAYAFGKYRLLDVEAKLKRGTRYIFALVFTIAVIALGITGLGVLLKSYAGEYFNIQVFFMLFAGVVLIINRFGSRQIGLRTYLEKKFFPERVKLRQMLGNFLSSAFAISDKETYWSQLNLRLCDGLAIQTIYPVMRLHDGEHQFVCGKEFTPFRASSDLLQMFERESKPLLVDEIMASGRASLTEDEQLWIREKKPALILPLTLRNQLTGFIALGPKKEGEDYRAEELQILQSLSLQIALTSENMNLLEDSLVKQRLEDEMKVARKIQEGMLPQRIPEIQGVEIAARSKFCLEVAGDYYDVILLENGSAILAVGDVSGKGTGAALIMANLQAALRTAVGFGVRLSDIVARINDLIFHNTTPEQYITFFVGIYEPSTKQFTYVNAGHNHPILLRNDGSTVSFDAGGVILGSIPGMPYQQETLKLESGDLLLLYTDGVSEAMDEKEEEFGEARIHEAIVKYRKTLPQDALIKLEDEVIAFHRSDNFSDDFTLLLCKII